MFKSEEEIIEERRKAGHCVWCGNSNYHEVCYRGNPKHGPDGFYCEACFREANISLFGEESW